MIFAALLLATLTDFTGIYAYRDGAEVAIVPKGDSVVAVIGESIYALRRVGGDEFRNGAGIPVVFVRDAGGKVTGVKEGEDFFPIRTRTVPREIVALMTPGRTSYRYQRPTAKEPGLDLGNAADAGFRTATLEQLVRSVISEERPNVHSILLWRRGRLVLEEYFYGYDRERPHQLRSATKSFISALVGIAVKDDKRPIAELLPWPVTDEQKRKITVADLLSMRSGLACDDRDRNSPGSEQGVLYSQPDWARFTIELPMIAEPGTVARYCSGGTHVAGRMVEHVTGRDLLTFANTSLFAPLGFRNHRWPYQPIPQNANEFGQLYLRPRDMLKFGILYLNGGVWRGRQLIAREWVERSMAPLTRIGSREYGYLWWRQRFGEVDTIVASGNGGQKIYIVPSLQLVAVFTGGNYNAEQDSPPNAIMRDVILLELAR